nr:MAG TPA: hypothetical protein [Crassvirales sp.]
MYDTKFIKIKSVLKQKIFKQNSKALHLTRFWHNHQNDYVSIFHHIPKSTSLFKFYNLCKYVESNHNLNFSVAQHDFGTLRSVFLFLSSSDLSYHISFIKLRFP